MNPAKINCRAIILLAARCSALCAALALGGFALQAQQSAAAGSEAASPESGTVRGTVTDRSGASISGAKVTLTRDGKSWDTTAGADGQFTFLLVSSGPFQLTISAPGFATQVVSGSVAANQVLTLPPVTLALATESTEIRVTPSLVDVAEDELKQEEKQRVLGFVPNYYVTYIPDAAPLNSRQKFQLAWKTSIDPVTFGLSAAVAGIQQASNTFPGYGQGGDGYAKRFGATYADFAIGTYIGGAILPSLFKQDPRYFYKGTGSKRARVWYALEMSVLCKSDKGRRQVNYSGILGSLAAGGISNLYYPSQDRNGLGLTVENTLIGIGGTAAANLLQEFVIKKLTPNAAKNSPVPGAAHAATP